MVVAVIYVKHLKSSTMTSTINRNSLEGNETDLTALIAGYPESDEMPDQIMIVKRLCDAFEDCIGEGENIPRKEDADMKVYLRMRPITLKLSSDNTITANSGEMSHSICHCPKLSHSE